MDEIDGELSRYDQVEVGLETSQRGVGFRMMGSALFLKNLFTQEKPPLHNSSLSMFTRVPRKFGMVLEPLGVVLSKHSRQEKDGVLEEVSERCKKRVTYSNDLTMEADGQPRQQP